MTKKRVVRTKTCPREKAHFEPRYIPDEYDRCDHCVINDYDLLASVWPCGEQAEGGYSEEDVIAALRKAEKRWLPSIVVAQPQPFEADEEERQA